jgi:diguanylate cyclase
MEIPLVVRGRLEGFLEFRSAGKDAYGVAEASAAIKFSDHAVVALANAFRYQAAELEASTDWLTGLPTRRSFMTNASRMEEAAPGISFSVLMIDIDHFKKVNDSFGHPVGDTVLAAVADVCRSAFRTKDLFCRYGGEEIVALLPGADAETAVKVAERVRSKVECLRIQDYPEMRLSVSIGVCAGEKGVDFRDLIVRADEALYMAKESGRNRCELR